MLIGLFDTSIIGMQKSFEQYNKIVRREQESDLIRDLVEMVKAKDGFKANTKGLKVADEMLGTIIDILA